MFSDISNSLLNIFGFDQNLMIILKLCTVKVKESSVCLCVRACMCMYCVRVYICVCVFMCICMCMHLCLHVNYWTCDLSI